MVHLPHMGKRVKEELLDDPVAAQSAEAEVPSSHNKRSRLALVAQQQSNPGITMTSNQQSMQHGFLDEPPLGLRLKKSPSLVELVQMKLAQASKATDARQARNKGTSEKLKASNFPGSVLRIGSWEWVSKYEGDLVAKCYFAKHKLVWEVLDGGLKSKIEIQWSDICGLKMFCPENEFGTLEIALSRPPLFFRETNPQPRKHTLWQATSDFTGGQATMNRVHFLQCPPGMMNRHVGKLVRCDQRLYSLSQQNDFTLDSPYFESKCAISEGSEDLKHQRMEQKDDEDQSGPKRSNALLSPHSAAGRIDAEARQPAGTSDVLSEHFPSSVGGIHMITEDSAASVECTVHPTMSLPNGSRVPGISRSMSKSEIANYIGQHMYRQMYSGNLPATGDGGAGSSGRGALDEFTRYLSSDSQMTGNDSGKVAFDELTRQLLNDTQITDGTDERMLMSRVNSLCCLIQKDSSLNQLNPGGNEVPYDQKPQNNAAPQVRGDSSNNGSLPPRQESFGGLLTNLPRIASFPHFF